MPDIGQAGEAPLDRLQREVQVGERERRPVVGQRRARAAAAVASAAVTPGTTVTSMPSAIASVRAAMPCTPASPLDTSATRASSCMLDGLARPLEAPRPSGRARPPGWSSRSAHWSTYGP